MSNLIYDLNNSTFFFNNKDYLSNNNISCKITQAINTLYYTNLNINQDFKLSFLNRNSKQYNNIVNKSIIYYTELNNEKFIFNLSYLIDVIYYKKEDIKNNLINKLFEFLNEYEFKKYNSLFDIFLYVNKFLYSMEINKISKYTLEKIDKNLLSNFFKIKINTFDDIINYLIDNKQNKNILLTKFNYNENDDIFNLFKIKDNNKIMNHYYKLDEFKNIEFIKSN